MKPSEALEALRENEARYAHEVATGTRLNGNPMKPELVEKRKESLRRVRVYIQILEKWAATPPRDGGFLNADERELIGTWNIDPVYIFASVQR